MMNETTLRKYYIALPLPEESWDATAALKRA